MYDMEQWKKDGTLKPKEGEEISEEIYNQLLNSMPPAMNTKSIFQMGEAWDHVKINNRIYPRYYTFIKKASKWVYIGKSINDIEFINDLASLF
jgi:hypothetical protein